MFRESIMLLSYVFVFCLHSTLVQSQAVIPSMFSYSGGRVIRSVNGSSITGGCSDIRFDSNRVTCFRPTSSILFDENVPTLTGLDGDMWASQLLTVEAPGNNVEFTFNFTDTPGYTGVGGAEVVMFNCPELGISVETFTFTTTSGTRSVNPTTTSCDSLVTVQLPSTVIFPQQVITLQCNLPSTSTWVHLAEVTFFTDVFTSSPTTQETTNNLSTSDSADQTTIPNTSVTQRQLCEACSSFTATAIAITAIITAIITALVATVVFAIVLVSVFKFHPKLRSRGAMTGESTVLVEEHVVYDDVVENMRDEVTVRGEEMSDYINYMEIREEGEESFALEENAAYGRGENFILKINAAYDGRKAILKKM